MLWSGRLIPSGCRLTTMRKGTRKASGVLPSVICTGTDSRNANCTDQAASRCCRHKPSSMQSDARSRPVSVVAGTPLAFASSQVRSEAPFLASGNGQEIADSRRQNVPVHIMGASSHLDVRRWGGGPSNPLKPSSIASAGCQQARLSSCTQLASSIIDLHRTCSPVLHIRPPCIDAFDET